MGAQQVLNEQAIFLNVIADGAQAVLTLPPWHPTPSRIKARLPRLVQGPAHLAWLTSVTSSLPWPLSPLPNSDQEFLISKPRDLSCHSSCEQTGMSFWSLPRTFPLTLQDPAQEPPPLGSCPCMSLWTWPLGPGVMWH